MPNLDQRAPVVASPLGRRKTAGNYTVKYIDNLGKSMNARVLGPGTTSGLKLFIPTRQATSRIIDNVARLVNRTNTNVYTSRV